MEVTNMSLLTLLLTELVQSMNTAGATHLPSSCNISSTSCIEYHPIIAIKTEQELYKVIGFTSNTLFKLIQNETLFAHHDTVTVSYRGDFLFLFNITRKTPFFVVTQIVSILHKWYEYQWEYQFCNKAHQYLDDELNRHYHELTHLTLQLRNPHRTYDMNSFRMLSKSLDILDGYFRKFTGSKCNIFQRYLYHNEYVYYISDHKLKIVALLGEGSSASCFKVQSILNQQFYALKLFKHSYRGSFAQEDCKSETLIMERINRIGNVHVPRLIFSDCQHYYFLMECLERKSRTASTADGVRDAMEMYVQISATIEVLAQNGISHGDLTDSNILHATNGKFYLLDLGSAIDFQRGRGNCLGNWNYPNTARTSHHLLATWYYYSPSHDHMSDLLINQSWWNISKADKVDLILKLNLYCLSSVVLYKICRSKDFYHLFHRDLCVMQTLHDRANTVWRQQGSRGWNLIRELLSEIWKVRSSLAEKYAHRFPQSYFTPILTPLIMIGNTIPSMHTDDWESEADTLHGVTESNPCGVECILS